MRSAGHNHLATMAANSSLVILHPRLQLFLKPAITTILYSNLKHPLKAFSAVSPLSSSSFSLSHSRKHTILKLPLNSSAYSNHRKISSLSSSVLSQSANSNPNDDGGSEGLSSSSSSIEMHQKIDVNPPKGTRDFPPEDMRVRKWLFQNFKEVNKILTYST